MPILAQFTGFPLGLPVNPHFEDVLAFQSQAGHGVCAGHLCCVFAGAGAIDKDDEVDDDDDDEVDDEVDDDEVDDDEVDDDELDGPAPDGDGIAWPEEEEGVDVGYTGSGKDGSFPSFKSPFKKVNPLSATPATK